MASSSPTTRTPHVEPIILSVQRGISRSDDPDTVHADTVFNAIKPLIRKRDNGVCVYCNFKADKWQDYHHLDGDHHNNSASNIVTACRLCHLAHHLGFIGATNIGCVILCPEISQAALNNLVRSLWVGKHGNDSTIRSQSTAMLESLLGFTEVARREYGYQSTLQLANEMLSLPRSKYKNRAKYLEGLRIIFYEKGFQEYIMYWCTNTYKSTPTRDWLKIAESHLDQLTLT